MIVKYFPKELRFQTHHEVSAPKYMFLKCQKIIWISRLSVTRFWISNEVFKTTFEVSDYVWCKLAVNENFKSRSILVFHPCWEHWIKSFSLKSYEIMGWYGITALVCKKSRPLSAVNVIISILTVWLYFLLAPEVLGPEHYNKACDMWSLGVIMYIL